MSDEQTKTPAAYFSINRKTGDPEWSFVRKQLNDDGEYSYKTAHLGENDYPFNASGIEKAVFTNPHHSTCLQAKVNATVGLGFLSDDERENGPESMNSNLVSGEQDTGQAVADALLDPMYLPSKADNVLDPLCDISFNELITNVAWDFFKSGNGYIEVARDENGTITNLWWLPWSDVKAWVENRTGSDYHWVLQNQQEQGREYRLARFGDREGLADRAGSASTSSTVDPLLTDTTPRLIDPLVFTLTDEVGEIHEVIHIKDPMGTHKIYGSPKYLAASTAIELIQAQMQYKYDFFLNRCVPEYMLFITGGVVEEDDWKKIEDGIKDNTGLGKSHKSFSINLSNPDIEVIVEKFEPAKDTVFQDKEKLDSDVVTAHRVPPLLANILIPGKLGATNEFPNALLSFQLLCIHQAQRVFQRTFARTLGSEEAGLGLEEQDFHFRKITDLINLNKADTMSRMRETLPEAQAEGRDLSDGVRD